VLSLLERCALGERYRSAEQPRGDTSRSNPRTGEHPAASSSRTRPVRGPANAGTRAGGVR